MSSANVRAWRAFYARNLDLYGVTPRDYRLLYVAQKGCCWGCRKAKGIHPDDPKARGTRRLGVDHNHTTGVVRGLLCSGGDKTCNRTIGWHDADTLERLAAYRRDRMAQPARVLAIIEQERLHAADSGVELTDAEVDALAVAFLWPDR
jgi:hypothetical protein